MIIDPRSRYAYLNHEPAPRMLVEALRLYGIMEVLGPENNAVIMSWAKEIGQSAIYTSDAVAWCGLFIGLCAKRAAWPVPKHPLWARDWQFWGTAQKIAMLGDVLVFPRGQGGHVALYVGEDRTHYHILGGNQTDMVNIVRRAKTPILAIRRAPWRRLQPPNVRRIMLGTYGPVAGKET